MERYRFVRTPDPEYIETEKEARSWCDRYMACHSVGFDTETTGLSKVGARVKFFSFSDGESRICGPVRLLRFFAELLENPNVIKRMSNAKFDMHMAANHGILLRGECWDSNVQDWYFDENRPRHGLKECARDHLGLRMSPFKDVFGAIGSTEKEVKMVTRFHDILEAGDKEAAADALIAVGKADGDEEVIKSLKKMSLSKQGDYLMGSDEPTKAARKLLAIGRIHGLATRTPGKAGFVADYLNMLSGMPALPTKEREAFRFLLEDMELLKEAHEYLLHELRKLVSIDMDPLEMLKLLVGDYASLDAWASYVLCEVILEKLGDEAIDDELYTLADYYVDEAVPYTRVLWNMERRGFPIDMAVLDKQRIPMGKKISALERKVVSLVGRDVNLRSSQQMLEIFYEKDGNGNWVDSFGDPPIKWTKGGASGVKMPSTDKEVIAVLADKGDEVAKVLQEHRQFSKLHDTYLTGLPTWADHRGRIHTDLKQGGARTGRLASGDPNLQNIPARGEDGSKIRLGFVAGKWGDCSPDWCVESLLGVSVPDLDPDTPMTLIVADYAQLEMRILAHFSEDEELCKVIRSGKDIHSMTAALAGGYDYVEVAAAKKAHNPTPRQKELLDVRSGMKAVGFGIMYGIGAVKLGRDLDLPITTTVGRNGKTYERCPEGQKLIDTYFGIYKGVKRWINDIRENCREDLFVQTICGRFRRLPDIVSSERGLAAEAERQASNSVIQGSAADICNKAMLKCEHDPELRALGVRMLMQIHDELVFEAPDIPKFLEPSKDRVRVMMEDPYPMLVPIQISMDTARSWGEAK